MKEFRDLDVPNHFSLCDDAKWAETVSKINYSCVLRSILGRSESYQLVFIALNHKKRELNI